MYRADRVARQFGYDQRAPGTALLLQFFKASQRSFLDALIGSLILGKEGLALPVSDLRGVHMTGFRLF